MKNIGKSAQKQELKDYILKKIEGIYHLNNGTVGYRMMTDELKQKGIILSPNTVYKYMKELDIKSIVRPKYQYTKGEAHKVFDNLLNRDFTASKPNEKWCIDFTYLHTQNDGKCYNCTILDLYDRSIVASVTGKNIDSDLAIRTVRAALSQAKKSKSIILHSDQGSQFTSKKFTAFCKNNKIVQSMSRAGNPYDNAPIERFFNTLKCEFYYLYDFNTFETLKKCLNKFVFARYNHSRPHTFNKGLTPMKARGLFKCA